MTLCDKKLGMTHTNDFCEKKSDKVTTFSGPKKEEEITIFSEYVPIGPQNKNIRRQLGSEWGALEAARTHPSFHKSSVEVFADWKLLRILV